MQRLLCTCLSIVILGAICFAATQRAAASEFLGTWSGTWEGGGSGGFELTLEKGTDNA